MNYQTALNVIDTQRALAFLEQEATPQGAYYHFPCPEQDCDAKASMKAYGDKKNLWYCPSCKKSGHILSLTMKLKGVEYEEAKKLLLKRARPTQAKLSEALSLDYELEYSPYMEAKGIPKEIADLFGIGVPKGKTMLSGCVAFTVKNEDGVKVAYFGIRIKDGKRIFHKSFNPELYLYGIDRIDPDQEVVLRSDIYDCVRVNSFGRQCVSNFGLPYLSEEQIKLLANVPYITFEGDWEFLRNVSHQVINKLGGYYRFKVT